MEGDALRAAGFAKIAKTTRVKAEKALKGGGIVNFAKTTLLKTKYGILLLIKFLSKFSPMQLSLGTLIASVALILPSLCACTWPQQVHWDGGEILQSLGRKRCSG